MRVFIRSSSDRKFMADKDQWVSRRDRALDFVSSVVAADVATRMGLKRVQIVLSFGNLRPDVVVEIPDVSKNAPRIV